MPRNPLREEMLEALRHAATPGAFAARFYRVRVSPRRERRYRRPGRGSPLSRREARAIQAFRVLQGCSINALAKRFHRSWRTIRKALADPSFIAYVSSTRH